MYLLSFDDEAHNLSFDEIVEEGRTTVRSRTKARPHQTSREGDEVDDSLHCNSSQYTWKSLHSVTL